MTRINHGRAVPKVLFCGNGSEFTSHAMDLWAYQNEAKIDFSRPSKPHYLHRYARLKVW